MLYLADKYQRFMPTDNKARWKAKEWLMWQMGGLGPILGQTHHFVHFNPGKAQYAEQRFFKETERLYSVLEKQLEGREFIIDEYTIVDMACWPWISRHEWQNISLGTYPNIRNWYKRLAERPAVQAGYHVPSNVNEIPPG